MERLWFVAQYDYTPVNDDELKYKAGDRIQQLEPPNRKDPWFLGSLGGKKGLVDPASMSEMSISPADTSRKKPSPENVQPKTQQGQLRRDTPVKPKTPRVSIGGSSQNKDSDFGHTMQERVSQAAQGAQASLVAKPVRPGEGKKRPSEVANGESKKPKQASVDVQRPADAAKADFLKSDISAQTKHSARPTGMSPEAQPAPAVSQKTPKLAAGPANAPAVSKKAPKLAAGPAQTRKEAPRSGEGRKRPSEDLAKALRGLKGESNKKQAVQKQGPNNAARTTPDILVRDPRARDVWDQSKDSAKRASPIASRSPELHCTRRSSSPLTPGTDDIGAPSAKRVLTSESSNSLSDLGALRGEGVAESSIVMLCFSTGELDDSVLSTLRAIGQAVGAKVLLSSEMGFQLFDPRPRSLVLESNRNVIQSDYLKFGAVYIDELYEKLSKSYDSDELITYLLFKQLDRKWKSWKDFSKNFNGRFDLQKMLESSYFVKPATSLPLKTFNLDFATSGVGAKSKGKRPVEDSLSPTFDERKQTWQMQGGASDVEFERKEMALQYLPGDADTRVSVLRLYTAAACDPAREYERLVDGFAFVFRARPDVEKLLERYETIQEETLNAEINERRVTLQIHVPAEQVTSFTFANDESSLHYFLDNWEAEVLKALGDSERAKPQAWKQDASCFEFLECIGVDDSELSLETPWNVSALSSKAEREELCSLIRFGAEDQVGTVSFLLHLKDEKLPEAKLVRTGGWLEPQNVFPEQQEVAERILERMSFVLREQGKRFGTNQSLSDFTDLKFVVLLPIFTTLRDQTLTRIQDLLSSASQSQVFFYSLHNSTSFSRFREDARTNPATLFLLIADECHWGVIKDAAHDVFVNDPVLCEQPNVFMLLVSATPYNTLTSRSRVPCRPVFEFEGPTPVDVSEKDVEHSYSMAVEQEELHVIEWFPKRQAGRSSTESGTAHVDSRRYLRLEYYLSTIHSKVRHEAIGLEHRPVGAQKIRSDPGFEQLKKQFLKEPSKVRFDVVLLADYIFSLVYFACVRWDQASGTLRDLDTCSVDMEVKAKRALDTFARLTQTGSGGQPARELSQAAAKYLVHLHELTADSPEEDDSDECNETQNPIAAATLADVFKQKLSEEAAMGSSKPSEQEATAETSFLTETDIIVRDLLRSQGGKGRMKVVRTYSEKYACLWESKLKECQQELFRAHPAEESCAEDPFAVIMDTGTLSLYQRLHPWVLRREVPFCTCPRDARPPPGERCTKQHAIKDLTSGLQYIHLLDLPCILILVDKGRMGDTFPQSMDCLDLRIRVSLNRTTLIQELGRLCRYPSFDADEVHVTCWNDAKVKVGPFFSAGKTVAVFLQDRKTFVGYASHLLNFEALAEIKLCTKHGKARVGPRSQIPPEGISASLEFVQDHSHAEGMEYVLGIEGESFEEPCVVRVSEAQHEHGSKERKAFNRSFLLSQVNQTRSHPTSEQRPAHVPLNTVFLGVDVSSLEHLVSRCKGRCIVRPLSHPFPCALIRADVMEKLQKAVEASDNRALNPDITKAEISLCVQLGSLDKFMVQKGKIKNFEYHQYRKHWCPTSGSKSNPGHFDAPERRTLRHERRFLLFAECQIGKTGAYVSLLHQLRSRISFGIISEQASAVLEYTTVVEPDRLRIPKAIHWLYPYWLRLANAKSRPYFRVGPSKYREKFAVFRFRALLDCCTKAESAGPDASAQMSWVAEYERRMVEDECILSSASKSLLKQALGDLRSARPPAKWIDQGKKEFENFLDDDTKKGIVEDAVNWDRRLNWETGNPLLGSVLDVKAIPGREHAALLHSNLPRCWADVYNRPRTEVEDGGTVNVTLKPNEKLVTIAVPINRETASPSCFKSRQGRCPRRDMVLDPAMQKGGIRLASITSESIRLNVPEEFIAKGFVKVKHEANPGVVAAFSEKAGCFRWIFHPTSGRESKALLDYSSCIGKEYAQVFVVKSHEMERYLEVWGGYDKAVVLGLPSKMQTQDLFSGAQDTFDAGMSGVGFSRLFIQIVGYLLGLHFLWMLDDNISETREMDMAQVESGSHCKERPPKPCPIREPMAHLEWLVDSPRHYGGPVSGELDELGRARGGGWSWRAHPGDPGLWADQASAAVERSAPVSSASLQHFMGHPSGIGLVGMHRCWTQWMTLSNPFNKTHSVYSFVLMNVKDTCERGVFYPPKPAWEDIDFAFDLMDKGFQVVKVNRWFHSKLNFQARYEKPARVHGTVQTWNEGCRLTIRKTDPTHNPSKQCWFRMQSYVESFVAEWEANCIIVGSSNRPSWKAFTSKCGLPKHSLFENLQQVQMSVETRSVVFSFPPLDEDEEARSLPDLVRAALKRAMRSKVEKGGPWQQILLVIALDAASATPEGKPWTWGDFAGLVLGCGASVVEIATTAGDGGEAVEAFSACQMSAPRSRQCAESYFLLKVGFADAHADGGIASTGKQSAQEEACGAAQQGPHASTGNDGCESTTPRSNGGASSAKNTLQHDGPAADRKGTSLKSSDQHSIQIIAPQELVVNEASSERVRIPSGCRVTFEDHQNADLKEIRVEKVAPGRKMKAAAVRGSNILCGSSVKTGVMLGGAVHRFLPSATRFDPPVVLRLPVNAELQRELDSQGLEAKVGIFTWCEEENCWKEVSNPTRVSDSEVEVQSSSFSFYVTGFHSFVQKVVSLFSSNPCQIACFGGPEPEKHIQKDAVFDFKIQVCPVEHVPRNRLPVSDAPDSSGGGPVPTQDEGALIQCRLPTHLSISLRGHNFEEQVVDSRQPGEANDYNWTEVTESGHGCVHFALKYTPQNDGDPIRVWANIHELRDGQVGPKLKHLFMSLRPNQLISPAQPDAARAQPRIPAFFSRCRDDRALDTEGESQELRRSLLGVFDFHPHSRPSFSDFRTEMWNARTWKTRIVHFAGHGERQGLYWVNDAGTSTEIKDSQTIATLLGKESLSNGGSVACVVLNACKTKDLAVLIRDAGVQRVICWDGNVHEEDAKTFAGVFYSRLAHLHRNPNGKDFGSDLDTAFEDGKLDVERARRERKLRSGPVPRRAPTKPAEVVPCEAELHIVTAEGVVSNVGSNAAAGDLPRHSTGVEEVGGLPQAAVRAVAALSVQSLDDLLPPDAAPYPTPEGPTRLPTSDKGEWERRAFEAILGGELLYDGLRVEEAIRAYWADRLEAHAGLAARGLEETCHRSPRGKFHLRYTAQALQRWFGLPDAETPVWRYLEIFSRSGSHGALVHAARATTPAKLSAAIAFLGKSLSIRRDDLARHGSAKCDAHREMAAALEACIQHLSDLLGKATRSASDTAAQRPPDQQELPAEDMVHVFSQVFSQAELRALLARLKKPPEADELETKVDVQVKGSRKQDLLEILVGIRVKGRSGLDGFVEWMLSKPGMCTKKALREGARKSMQKHLLRKLNGLVARPTKKAKVGGAEESIADPEDRAEAEGDEGVEKGVEEEAQEEAAQAEQLKGR